MKTEDKIKRAAERAKTPLHIMGDCAIATYCIARELRTHDIDIKIHYGILDGGKFITLHIWASYDGKIIDMASFRQPNEKATALLLDKPVSPKAKAKRVNIRNMRSSDIQQSLGMDGVVAAMFHKYGTKGTVSAKEYIEWLNDIAPEYTQKNWEIFIYRYTKEEMTEVA